MSILFPKLNKPREWDYRPIYYDPEKEAREAKLAQLKQERTQQEAQKNMESTNSQNPNNGEKKDPYVPHLQKGFIRASREQSEALHSKARKASRTIFWLVLILLLVGLVWLFLPAGK